MRQAVLSLNPFQTSVSYTDFIWLYRFSSIVSFIFYPAFLFIILFFMVIILFFYLLIFILHKNWRNILSKNIKCSRAPIIRMSINWVVQLTRLINDHIFFYAFSEQIVFSFFLHILQTFFGSVGQILLDAATVNCYISIM